MIIIYYFFFFSIFLLLSPLTIHPANYLKIWKVFESGAWVSWRNNQPIWTWLLLIVPNFKTDAIFFFFDGELILLSFEFNYDCIKLSLFCVSMCVCTDHKILMTRLKKKIFFNKILYIPTYESSSERILGNKYFRYLLFGCAPGVVLFRFLS